MSTGTILSVPLSRPKRYPTLVVRGRITDRLINSIPPRTDRIHRQMDPSPDAKSDHQLVRGFCGSSDPINQLHHSPRRTDQFDPWIDPPPDVPIVGLRVHDREWRTSRAREASFARCALLSPVMSRVRPACHGNPPPAFVCRHLLSRSRALPRWIDPPLLDCFCSRSSAPASRSSERARARPRVERRTSSARDASCASSCWRARRLALEPAFAASRRQAARQPRELFRAAAPLSRSRALPRHSLGLAIPRASRERRRERGETSRRRSRIAHGSAEQLGSISGPVGCRAGVVRGRQGTGGRLLGSFATWGGIRRPQHGSFSPARPLSFPGGFGTRRRQKRNKTTSQSRPSQDAPSPVPRHASRSLALLLFC